MCDIVTEISPHDINTYSCRVCLTNGEICNSFYDFVSFNGENKELRELYLAVARIEVFDNDAKPTQICETCTMKLLAAFEFMLNAEKSEEALNTYMAQKSDTVSNELTSISKDSELNVQVVENNIEDNEEIAVDEVGTKIESMRNVLVTDNIETESEKEDRPCEQFEILDEFEFILDKDTGNTVEVTTDSIEETNEEKNLPPSLPKSTTGRNSIGSRLSLSSNNRSHRFNCTVCERTFAKFQSFQCHIESAHTYAPREEIAAKLQNKPTVQCPDCPRNFMHKNDLQRHMLALHPTTKSMETDENESVDANKSKRKYNRGLCPHCGKDFPVASLNIHIRRHLGVNPYKCDQCGKGFPRKQDLTIHQRHHSGERPHVCTVCGKSFIRPNKLSRHMRIHLGIRPYKCDECGKSFSQSNDLKIHMRRHSGEKPYACGVCPEAFISGTALRVHRKAKSHYGHTSDPDPFVNCRVNTRPPIVSNKS